jgi:hypothetical protein
MDTRSFAISRRSAIAGLGLASGAAALGIATPAAAAPAPPPPHGPMRPHTVPGEISPISSAPEMGVSYAFRSWDDFFPEDDLLYGRRFGGDGFYTSGASNYLAATFDLPPGALLHDLEWYVSNTAVMTVYANIWQSSHAFLDTFWSATIDAGSGVTAHRFVLPTAVNGPYPHGTRLMVAAGTSSNGSNLLNGVRAGFTHAPTSPVLLPSPVRGYDSRANGGVLRGGQSRTVSLAGHIPAGALGAIVNITVTGTAGTGFLMLYAAGTPKPTTSAINWFAAHQTFANQATTAVNLARAVTITAGGPTTANTHFIIDVVGYLV